MVTTAGSSVDGTSKEFNAYGNNYKGDIIASVRASALAKATTAQLARTRYDAYGNIKGTNTSTETPFGYSSEYTDSESGLQYLRARYYDPSTGRFTQEDSVEDPNNFGNLYLYCGGDPINFVDPSGYWRKVAKTKYKWKAEKGDTLSGLAKKLTGNANNWTKIGYKKDPKKLQIGEVVNVSKMINEKSTAISMSKNRTLRPDSELQHYPDDAIRRGARDKSLSGPERKRYQTEEKRRQQRNKQKRGNNNKSKKIITTPPKSIPQPSTQPKKGIFEKVWDATKDAAPYVVGAAAFVGGGILWFKSYGAFPFPQFSPAWS